MSAMHKNLGSDQAPGEHSGPYTYFKQYNATNTQQEILRMQQ